MPLRVRAVGGAVLGRMAADDGRHTARALLLRCGVSSVGSGVAASWTDLWRDFLEHARGVYACEGARARASDGDYAGGRDNVREFPEQQMGERSWECLQQQTSYPGVEAIVKVNGKDVKKRLPSLSPATARDARMTSTWQVSEATVQKIVNAAEAAAQRQEGEAAAQAGSAEDAEEARREARRRTEARRLPPGRPHEFTHWGEDTVVRKQQGIFMAAAARQGSRV